MCCIIEWMIREYDRVEQEEQELRQTTVHNQNVVTKVPNSSDKHFNDFHLISWHDPTSWKLMWYNATPDQTIQGNREYIPQLGNVINVSEEGSTDNINKNNISDEDVVDNVWKTIDDSIASYHGFYEQMNKTDNSRKDVIHFFISSTFADYHAEREVLVKKIIPDLREFCETHHVELLECDLRWGVPKNTATDDTIATCLDEITKCINETNGQPFFLNMLRERYGWIPKIEELSDEVKSKYQWVKQTSITHMEVIHAVLRTNSPNALFMIRDKKSLDGLPEDFKESFVENDSLAIKSLQRMKSELNTRFPDRTFQYCSKMSKVDDSTGMKKVIFKDLDDFSSKVKNFFLKRFEEYLNAASSHFRHSKTEKYQAAQEAFVQRYGKLVVGRHNEIKKLLDAVFLPHLQRRVMVVIGQSGSGKSAVLAHFVEVLKKRLIPCLYNFASAAPGSANPVNVLDYFISIMQKKMYNTYPSHYNTDLHDLYETFGYKLIEMCRVIPGLVIVLDAAEDFEVPFDQWLQRQNADMRMMYVVSVDSRNSRAYHDVVKYFRQEIGTVDLTEFNHSSREELVVSLFSKFNKQLDDEQLQTLVSADAAASPLWLSLACEDLRVFGVFEQVTEYIKTMPDTVNELMAFIIRRIIKEDETGKVLLTLCIIHCSFYEIYVSEIEDILRSQDGEVSETTWMSIHRQIKPFIVSTGESGQEIYCFAHSQMSQVIAKDFIQSVGGIKKVQSLIAKHFLQCSNSGKRIAEMIVRHVKAAGMEKELMDFYVNDRRSRFLSSHIKRSVNQAIRCPNRVQAPGGICRYCVDKKDLCTICGDTLSQEKKTSGGVCMVHERYCCVCGGAIHSYASAAQAFLCSDCATNKCARKNDDLV